MVTDLKGAIKEKPIGVSIICCTYNGRNRLPATFEAISKLDFIGDWEFILMDNASDDGTKEYTETYFEKTNIRTQVLICPKPGKNFALWMAFEAVNYKYILICDDDNELFPNYLSKGVKILEENLSIGALGGMGLLPSYVQKPDWFDAYQSTYAIGSQAKSNGPLPKGWGLYGAGCFFRFSAIQELLNRNYSTVLTSRKGNTLAAGGDTEMCLAVECLGYDIWFDEDLKFYHHIEERRLNWDYLLKLKSSIASNFPIMEPYRFIILGNSRSYLKFILKQIPDLLWNFAFTQLLYIVRPKPKNKAFRITYQNKMKGLFKNFKRSLIAFKKIKPIFLPHLNLS
ncbi:glycosyltransferase [Cecembia lonarensis]|uniref:Glycosyl transferase family 2 n=1 Tax=Cecembia lonarensis (strain CCUG 58316 / KCTC 22772 / LW9) TaxID=1225176 RepID=K1LX40_CECL9|nr:glycosyltransferase [Cecembia lonarensis]EKB48724.1 Glycosyl transferase family 2 [Cecembia lonarensis LW9]